MKLRLLTCAIIGVSMAGAVWAKKPVRPEYRQIQREVAKERAAEAKAPAAEEVGDADSFGKNVKFAGLMSTGVINLASDCTPDPSFPPGPDDHCFVTNPAPALTSFSVTDAARMTIPGKTAQSLFCHWQTPAVIYTFANPTGTYQPNARIVITPSYKIENPVLSDPALIDPNTGLPFNGSFTVTLPGIRHGRSLQPGEFQTERDYGTRACIGGLVSRAALIETYGLSESLADKFFKKDTIITMNITGQGVLVDFASIIYGTRFVSD